jgi:hypothetical protein
MGDSRFSFNLSMVSLSSLKRDTVAFKYHQLKTSPHLTSAEENTGHILSNACMYGFKDEMFGSE